MFPCFNVTLNSTINYHENDNYHLNRIPNMLYRSFSMEIHTGNYRIPLLWRKINGKISFVFLNLTDSSIFDMTPGAVRLVEIKFIPIFIYVNAYRYSMSIIRKLSLYIMISLRHEFLIPSIWSNISKIK